MDWALHTGDALAVLATLPADSVHCCVTSPPYWGLRDYGVAGQLGLEATPAEYVARMVAVFGAVRRVLRPDGTLWLNIGDSYAGGGNGGGGSFAKDGIRCAEPGTDKNKATRYGSMRTPDGLKPKDLCGIPWRLAFALQADGWWLRQDIIWHKPNPMPESVRDRCTKAHEYVFLLSKSERYYFDAEAVQEAASPEAPGNKSHAAADAYEAGDEHHRTKSGLVRYAAKARAWKTPDGWDTSKGEGGHGAIHRKGREKGRVQRAKDGAGSARPPGSRPHSLSDFEASHERAYLRRNKRSVWTICTQPFPEAHFATFPEALVEPCVLAGSPKGGTVLDPFAGAGTTGLVAAKLGRAFVGIELNPEYVAMAEKRCKGPLFVEQ